jgi:hypothetical protein
MLVRIRAALRRPRRRAAVVCAVVFLGAAIATAHTDVGGHHMGDTAAMCWAALVAGAMAVGGRPTLGRVVPGAPRPAGIELPTEPARALRCTPSRARGDPAVLQVFRR